MTSGSLNNLTIDNYRSSDIEITVSGIDSWDNISAKMYISTGKNTTPIITVNGTINNHSGIVSFSLVPTDFENLTLSSYIYECVIYNVDKTFVKNIRQKER